MSRNTWEYMPIACCCLRDGSLTPFILANGVHGLQDLDLATKKTYHSLQMEQSENPDRKIMLAI